MIIIRGVASATVIKLHKLSNESSALVAIVAYTYSFGLLSGELQISLHYLISILLPAVIYFVLCDKLFVHLYHMLSLLKAKHPLLQLLPTLTSNTTVYCG